MRLKLNTVMDSMVQFQLAISTHVGVYDLNIGLQKSDIVRLGEHTANVAISLAIVNLADDQIGLFGIIGDSK